MKTRPSPGQDAANDPPAPDPSAPDRPGHHVLRLYVSGRTARSGRIITGMRRFCETYLKDGYELDVIDVYQNPAAARQDQIVAVPTLLQLVPGPPRRLTGNLADRQRVLSGLGINAKNEPEP